MKLWNYFDIPNWESIRDRVNIMFTNVYPNIDKMKTLTFFPNDMVYQAVPDFKDWLDSQSIEVVGFAVFIFRYNTGDSRLHVDLGNPTTYRFNIPLMNTENSFTEFFDPPWDKMVEGMNESATEDSPHQYWEYGDEGHQIDNFVLNKPAILNVKTPHRVRVTEDKPRVCLTICPASDDQLTRFL